MNAIVYYSLGGTTGMVAEKLAQSLSVNSYPIEEIGNRKNNAINIAVGGYQATTEKKSAIKPLQFDSAGIEKMILCLPIWANTTPPAVNSFFEQAKLSGQKVILVLVSGSGKNASAQENVAKKVNAHGGYAIDAFWIQSKSIKKAKPEFIQPQLDDIIARMKKLL
ncbi:MAG: hypothetical protein H7Y41_06160 [Hyphomonadaceae bacterium]|nr:hypothetical protein [Clostridia bacterium]